MKVKLLEPMKVKLLEPIDGYEEIAEWRRVERGEWYISHDCTKPVMWDECCKSTGRQLVLTPKPLPVVEAPKWLGVVRDRGCVGNRFVVAISKEDGWLYVVNGFGNKTTQMLNRREVELYPTANIPIAPELAALFKEPHGCATNNT
jgi:hypothetical protein